MNERMWVNHGKSITTGHLLFSQKKAGHKLCSMKKDEDDANVTHRQTCSFFV